MPGLSITSTNKAGGASPSPSPGNGLSTRLASRSDAGRRQGAVATVGAGNKNRKGQGLSTAAGKGK